MATYSVANCDFVSWCHLPQLCCTSLTQDLRAVCPCRMKAKERGWQRQTLQLTSEPGQAISFQLQPTDLRLRLKLLSSSPTAALGRGVRSVQRCGHWTGSNAMDACSSTSHLLSFLPFNQGSQSSLPPHWQLLSGLGIRGTQQLNYLLALHNKGTRLDG